MTGQHKLWHGYNNNNETFCKTSFPQEKNGLKALQNFHTSLLSSGLQKNKDVTQLHNNSTCSSSYVCPIAATSKFFPGFIFIPSHEAR